MTTVRAITNPSRATASKQRGTMVCAQQGHGSVQCWQKHQRGTGFQA